METEIKAKFTLIMMYWVRLHLDDDGNEIPLDIIELIVDIFLYERVKFLKFLLTFNSADIALTDDGKCVSRQGITRGCNQVLADCDPVRTPTLWRIKVCHDSVI